MKPTHVPSPVLKLGALARIVQKVFPDFYSKTGLSKHDLWSMSFGRFHRRSFSSATSKDRLTLSLNVCSFLFLHWELRFFDARLSCRPSSQEDPGPPSTLCCRKWSPERQQDVRTTIRPNDAPGERTSSSPPLKSNKRRNDHTACLPYVWPPSFPSFGLLE